jgi:Glycosyl transferase family 2
MNSPLLICMTPVKNEAWILPAFLTATSLWADYIIVADQGSTDGSRKIYSNFPKVIVIENQNPDFNESERQCLLIKKAREIEGDKILFALDADEIFESSFIHTNDWNAILSSKKGDVFLFQWAQIDSDLTTYRIPELFFPWVFHDDGIEPHNNYVRSIHSMRIPYPIHERQLKKVTGFKVMHFQRVNMNRQRSKLRFMILVDFLVDKKSIVKLSRFYLPKPIRDEKHLIDGKFFNGYLESGVDLLNLIDSKSEKFWYDLYILERLEKYGLRYFSKIDIWDDTFRKQNNLKDPRNFFIKALHSYLRITQAYSHYRFIRVIDKCLKIIGL